MAKSFFDTKKVDLIRSLLENPAAVAEKVECQRSHCDLEAKYRCEPNDKEDKEAAIIAKHWDAICQECYEDHLHLGMVAGIKWEKI